MGSHISLAHLFKTRRGIRHITTLLLNISHAHSFMKANGGPLLQMTKASSEPPLAADISVPCGMWPCTARWWLVEYYDKGLESSASNAAMLVIQRPVNL